MKQIGEHLFEELCEDCIEGKVSVMNCRVGSASLCCGGCFEEIECETCSGEGVIETDCFPKYEQVCSDCKKEREENL